MKKVSKLLITLAATIALPAAGRAATYKFTAFQYPGADTSFFLGIDDYNRIIGYTHIGATVQGFMITSAGTLTTIAPAGLGSIYTIPSSINRNGGVVGTQFDAESNTTLFIDSGNLFRTLAQDLPQQTITGINAASYTVGNFLSPSGAQAVYIDVNGAYSTILPVGKCTYTADPALNDYSTVVGSCFTGTSTVGFVWTKGRFTYIQPPAGSGYIHPTSINNSGVIAGWYTDSSGFDHGFVLNGVTFTTVDYPAAGVTNTLITGINNSGKIVGYYTGTVNGVAFSASPQ